MGEVFYYVVACLVRTDDVSVCEYGESVGVDGTNADYKCVVDSPVASG